MHCPQCGQQVVSDGVRFCNRCGFALDGVKDLLSPSRLMMKTICRQAGWISGSAETAVPEGD